MRFSRIEVKEPCFINSSENCILSLSQLGFAYKVSVRIDFMMIRSTVIIVLLLILALPHSSVFSQTKELIIKGEIEGEIERVELYFWESKGNVRVKVDTFNLTENTFTLYLQFVRITQ